MSWKILSSSKFLMTKKQTIEQKVEELEGIIKKFEDGKFGIEEGIKEYEKANKEIVKIKDELESLELKISEIRDK